MSAMPLGIDQPANWNARLTWSAVLCLRAALPRAVSSGKTPDPLSVPLGFSLAVFSYQHHIHNFTELSSFIHLGVLGKDDPH